ncbi:Nif3-like dinuclear metal center hexameric protein, partial [Yersinia pestis]
PASQALLDAAVAHQADAILVHHGYFWKNEPVVVRGMKRNRLKTLLTHDINLYGYHLPLDAHPELGNNAQLAKLLEIQVLGEIESLLPYGEFTTPLNAVALRERLEKQLGRSVLHCGDRAPAEVRRIAWCTGGGQGYIQQAAEFGVDAFITGEVSEQTIHIAREMKVNFYAAGHHATERYGIKALGEWLAEQYQLDVTFIDIPNPA